MVAEATGAQVEAIPVDGTGTLDMAALQNMLDERVKMVSVGHVSNALGTVNPIRAVIALARQVGARVMINGAQAVSHWPGDVQALDCGLEVFASDKEFGRTAGGVLCGERDLLDARQP